MRSAYIDIFISPVKADKLTNKSRQRNTSKTHTYNTHTHTLRPDRPDKTEIHKLKHAIIKQWH